MSTPTIIVAGVAAGAVAAGGLAITVTGVRPTLRGRPHWPRRSRAGDTSNPRLRARRVQQVVAPIAGVGVWLVSGWLVAGLVTTVLVLAAPRLFATTTIARRRLARLEAVESWTRRLADLRGTGGGLEQTLTASLRTCPAPIQDDVEALVARLRAGSRTREALRALATDLADPAADLVVAVLLLDAERRGSGVTAALTDLADAVAEETAMRRRVDADRAKPRTSARIVTGLTLAAATAGMLNPTYTQPYDTATGQIVLAALSTGIAGCLWWLHHLALGRAAPRFLSSPKGGAR